TANVDSGLDKRTVVGPPGAQMRVVIIVLAHVELFGRVIDHQSKLHPCSPCIKACWALFTYSGLTAEFDVRAMRKSTLLASRGIPWRHSKIPHRSDTRIQCHSDDHKKERRPGS